MRRHTQPRTVRPPLRRIAIIPLIIMTNLFLIRTLEPSKPAANLVLDANTQAVACRPTARRVRIGDAREAIIALEVVCAAAATEFVGVGRQEGRGWISGVRGRLQCCGQGWEIFRGALLEPMLASMHAQALIRGNIVPASSEPPHRTF